MTDAYKIGVTVALNNLVSAELGKIASGFGAAEKSALAFSARMTAIGAAGAIVVEALKAGVDEARRFQNEVTRFDAMGFGDKFTLQAIQAAKSFDIMGQSYTENMKLIREASGVTGDPASGIELARIGSKFEANMRNYLGDEGAAKASEMMMAAFKTAELRGDVLDGQGQFNKDKVTADMDAMQQVFIASGGLVSPQDFLNFIKTGGAAAKGLSGEAFFFQEAHGIQETGGQRAGTSLMSNFQNLAMGRATHQVIQNLLDNQLLDASKVQYDKTGKVKGVQPEALVNAMQFLNSQFDWFEKNIEPQVQGLPKQAAIDRIAQLSSNRTAMNRNVQFYLERENIEKAVRVGHQASGIDKLYDQEAQTNQAKMNDLSANWHDLLNQIGTDSLPAVNAGLDILNSTLKGLKEVFGWKNDQTQKMQADGRGSLSGSLAWWGKQFDSSKTSAVPPSSSAKPMTVNVSLDGDMQTIAKGVTKIQVDGVAGMSSQGNSFDGRMSPLPVF